MHFMGAVSELSISRKQGRRELCGNIQEHVGGSQTYLYNSQIHAFDYRFRYVVNFLL
jgi:hypothetical protein